MDSTYKALAEIVGEGYVSNEPEETYIYSHDLGTIEPRSVDYVVMPRTTEEVQKIVKLANRDKIPLVPMGSGLNLNGLTIPLRGGIVVDLRRMDRILEVNEKSRYAIIETGVTEGKLKAYLERHHPDLQHSIPHAPPTATIVANALVHGQGQLAQLYGFHSDMLNGLEVVLPTGDLCKIGSCSLSPYWFSSGAPLPDLTGLFAGWFGTTGIVTKASFKLYPKPKLKDIIVLMLQETDLVPDIILKITSTGACESLNFGTKKLPGEDRGPVNVFMWITGNSDNEVELKRRILQETLKEYIQSGQGEYMDIPPDMKPPTMELPMRSDVGSADILKGGGYQEVEVIIPVESYPEIARAQAEISAKYDLPFYSVGARCIGKAHCMMCCFSYRFNRGDPDNVDKTRKALRDATEVAVKMGGLLWRPGVYGQKLMMEKMDPNTLKLMMKIKELMDPNHIMNPGNWEVS